MILESGMLKNKKLPTRDEMIERIKQRRIVTKHQLEEARVLLTGEDLLICTNRCEAIIAEHVNLLALFGAAD